MPSVQLKYLQQYEDRHGKRRIYFRRKGFRVPLRGPLESPEFWQDYSLALNGQIPPTIKTKPTSPTPILAKSMRWLCVEYYKSSAFISLEDSTQHVRRNILDGFCLKHGNKPYAYLKRQHLLKILDERAGTPSAANALIKALRQVFKFAVEYGYHNENPAIDISYLKSKNPEGIHPCEVVPENRTVV